MQIGLGLGVIGVGVQGGEGVGMDGLVHIASRPQTLSFCESMIYGTGEGTQESHLGAMNDA